MGAAASRDESNATAKKSKGERRNRSKKSKEEERKVPHMFEAIMREADMGSKENHIHSGIFLNNKRKKFWVDEESGHNCFMLFARDLMIIWGEDTRYWNWEHIQDAETEVASLLKVCWLEINGKFDTSYLTPGATYEVAFVAMTKESASGWDRPVNLKLKLADGGVQECKVCLQDKPRDEWVELKVGEFATSAEVAGEAEISLSEIESGQWKRGLLLKGMVIQPKKK